MNPKLKGTVKFFPVEGGLFHVYDSSTAKHFKLGAQEVSWLQLLDGSLTLENLRSKIPLEYFEGFVQAIQRLGVLEGSTAKKPFSWLKIKLFNIDPSALLNRLGNFPLYYREFLSWTSLPLLLLNLVLLATAWPQIQQASQSIEPGFGMVPFYFLFIVISGVIHELSHAVVARSHGVTTPHVGGMLMFFHPAFFADISGINLLPDRKRRVQVIFAGVQANNLLITVGFLLLMMPMGKLAFELVLFFTAINFVLILVNLIPFIEYDGYYIFQELLGEPRFVRNATINMLSPGPKKPEYVLFFVLSQLFQFSLIASILLALRMGVVQFWQGMIVDGVFLALLVVSYPALALYRIKKLG